MPHRVDDFAGSDHRPRDGDDVLALGDGIIRFKPQTEAPDDLPPVYRALAEHQQAEAWPHRALLTELHRWAALFEREFALGVPEFSLSIDRLRCTRFGQFRYGHNGFGLRGEIIINGRLLGREFWQILGILLHELLHGWQQAHGKPGRGNYHNREFREKAASYGLIVDSRGFTQFDPESRFFALLDRHGIRVPELARPTVAERVAGRSKLRKWSCGCTNVRIGQRTFSARCLKCGHVFEPADGEGW